MIENKKLAIVVSHPIQYHSPFFKVLAKKLNLKIFYCFNPNSKQQGEEGFGKSFKWDIDLFDGYEYEFLNNVSKNPGSVHKDGCDTPEVGERLKNYQASHVVVYGWQLKSYLQTAEYCKKNNIPIAVRGDSQKNPRQSILKRIIKKFYFPFFLTRFDKFLSVGTRNKEYLKSFGVKESDIIFSPHAINQDFWKGEKVHTEKIIFLWVGKFIQKKRPLEVIEAFTNAIKSNPMIELHLVGSGELLQKSKELARASKSIQFLGFKNQTELKEVYLKSSCLILPSDYGETWGLVVNEAFTNKLPAIVSDACGCSIDIINENTGLQYKFADVKQLEACILKMAENLGNNVKVDYYNKGIDKINASYNYSKLANSMIEFINL